MKRTAFVCLGSRRRGDALHYQELPTKEDGEEFFIFFESGSEQRNPLIKQLFRDAISAPRMGYPIKYLLHLIDRLNTLAGGIDEVEELLADSVLAVMIRRHRDVYLFHNAGIAVLHWDGAAVAERPVAEIPGFTDMPLRRTEGQGNLFSRFTEELFVLRHFTLADGNHTLILAPSHDFAVRNMETFRNSICFPGFELSSEREVTVETGRSFPAIHWNTTGEEPVKQASRQNKKFPGKFSIPATVGIVTALVALFLFFGPLSRKGSDDGGSPVLLSDDESGQAIDTRTDADEPAVSIEARNGTSPERVEMPRGIDFSPAWSEHFTSPVTSSPQVHQGTIYFGCRDSHLYAFAADGTRKWGYNAGEGIGATPRCTGRYVIGADYGGNIFCLDAATGTAIWSFATNERIVSSPQAAGDMVLIATMEGNLIALNLSDGAKRWSQKLGTGIWANVHLDERYIVTATTDGSLVKLDHSGKIEWRVKPGGGILSSPLCLADNDLIVFGSKDTYIYAYSLSKGNLMWRAAAGGEVNGGGVSDGETILVGSDDGNIYALSMNGRIRWKQNLGGAVKSSPLIIGDTALVTSYGSKICAIKLESGEIINTHTVESPIYSSPTHDGVRVYFGTNGGTFHALWMYGGVGGTP